MLEGSRESSVGWLICFSKPNRYVDILSNPWLESAATVGNYLLLISNMGLGIKLSIKGVWWETESSSARAASEWRPHLPHRHFTHRSNLGHQQMSLCSDEKLARSALAASPKTSGFMPSPASLLESVAGALVRRSAERLQGPTGLAGCCLQIQALILWFWMSWKGSIKFGGLMKRICSISCCIECFFRRKIGIPDCPVSDILWKYWLRTPFLCFLFFFLVAMTKTNHHFKIPGTHM